MSTKRSTAITLLLYWLLVVCGLEGITIVRSAVTDTASHELAAIWTGTIAGVAIGQLLAWLRLRAWLLVPVAIAGLWIAPIAWIGLYEAFGPSAGTCAMLALPAFACGYLSLSERGGLAALWFPTMLWMVFVLEGRGSTAYSLDARASLPFVIGLGVLFVAFLRAQATRRAALWQSHTSVRLGYPRGKTVLRASPLRGTKQFAWAASIGGGALVLAAWVAPHLWQREHARRQPTALGAEHESTEAGSGHSPCCPAHMAPETRRVVVKEYIPLLHGSDEIDREHEREIAATCVACVDGQPLGEGSGTAFTASGSGSVTGGAGVADPFASGAYGSGVYPGGAPGAYDGTPAYTPPSTYVPPYVPPPADPTPPAPAPEAPKPKPTTTTTTKKTAALAPKEAPPLAPPVVVPTTAAPPPAAKFHPTSAVDAPSASPAVPVSAPQPSVAIAVPTTPRSLLAIVLGGLALVVAARAARRAFKLRHLARPFWNETLDQRISNHWQRMLLGLRDAGIFPTEHEQPAAFAERVGIEGMATCATILERVRHGVRVDASDLDAMNDAASAVYRRAREQAGFAARAASWLRVPT